MFHECIHFNEEVAQARLENKPIVALESTLISHGLPYPENIKTAEGLEHIIREQGATPATIALHEGKIHIGLNQNLMNTLAQSKNIIKASRRDLAYTLSQNLTASTTVAATMYCAHLAGISVFATGGIGGVHEKVIESFDISADLMELAKTPITVVCSGAKSILDLPKTLELLETSGVPVIGYQTHAFPAFFSQNSGLTLDQRLDTPEDISTLMQYQRKLHLDNGILIANPIPKASEIPYSEIMPLIKQAQKNAHAIQGKAITPYLLQQLNELSQGKTLIANMELIKNNALLGAKIALAYQKQII